MRTDHTLIGPYVLGALGEDERAGFERHLVTCAACAVEVAELAETATRLADEAVAEPPRGFREAVLRSVSITRREPPVVDGVRVPGGSWRRRALFALAAAVVAVALAAVTFVVQERRVDELREQATAQSATAGEVAAILGAPDAVSADARAAGGGGFVVVYSAGQDASVVFGVGLPALTAGRVYQAWVGEGGSVRDAGVMTATAPMVVHGMGRADLVALSVEPEGGSDQPTLMIGAISLK
ncbi:anti-sigma factor [Phytomonospora endophytica]|uniref:Regulator of SigK n=1 Tax=Phytomonospora endophytica TaxID=714109 RepID=A0A841FS17_9ACTN|nr:anti-sigma factor [Phytomonospora endophytica]MBB6038594.1 anti-sigma-K factor RskA [Phytomonospora endophytica]GIG69263.1 hypothetical protein Pen01_55580 [Phytomonospora endophytica]